MTQASMPAQPLTNAIVRVARLQRLLAQQMLRGVGLHLGQELVMMQLWERGPQTQTDLVRTLDSDSATMTRMVRRLENAGFVRTRPSSTDKRATIVEPTPASQAVRREVERSWAELEGIAVGDLTPEQQAEALDVLARLEANLASSRNGPSIRE
ncbi:MarR family winged helix-turn-helix transcriptional regulator [Kribbella sp. NPDC003505]|uniref:MarR family winged helix-turn-helix transcriptional regulator n=1 Tax=Kribbella sp. NPDC003505 TaxID=3154448 RepID=UPI00339DDEFD